MVKPQRRSLSVTEPPPHWAKKLLVLYSLQKVKTIVIQDGPSEPFSCCGYLGSKGQVQGRTILWVSSRGSWCVGGGSRADPEDTRPEVGGRHRAQVGVSPLSRPRCSEENTCYKQGPQLMEESYPQAQLRTKASLLDQQTSLCPAFRRGPQHSLSPLSEAL